MSIDLNKLSLKELKDLQSQVAKAVASFEDRKKKEALVELEEKAREMGFSLAELTGAAVTRKRAPATAKYANPANASVRSSPVPRGQLPRRVLQVRPFLKSGIRPKIPRQPFGIYSGGGKQEEPREGSRRGAVHKVVGFGMDQ